MRKIISVMLIALMLGSVLASCNADDGTSKDTAKDTTTQAVEKDTQAADTTVGTADNTSATTDTAEVTTAEPEPLPDFVLTQESVVATNSYPEYTEFNKLAQTSYLVPGLNQKIVPQGMDIWTEKNWLMISGYFSDASVSDCSMIVAVDMVTGELAAEYKIKNQDGSNHTGHAGGVAITPKNMFISMGSQLLRIPLADIEAAGRQGDLRIVDAISVPARASFCNYSGGYLWVGDFYYGTSYPTDEYRHMTNREGKTYYAWSVGYKLDSSTDNEFSKSQWTDGMEYATPNVILSIDQKIQGFAVVSDKYIALSQSYGRNNDSKIMLYENIIGTTPHSRAVVNGKQVPLYFLDGKIDSKFYDAPPMSEGLAARDGKLYILFESGAEKYHLGGGKNPTDRVWEMTMPE